MAEHPSTPYHASTGASGQTAPRQPRQWTEKGFFPFRLEVLTPVFIGSGEDLSPLEYVIRQEGDKCFLHLVDTEAWLQGAADKSDVANALDTGNMLALRRCMHNQLDAGLYSLGRMRVSSDVAQALVGHIGNPYSMSKAEVQPFTRNPVTMAAFVPGSCLKGALSTPLIDTLDGGRLKAAVRSHDKNAYARTLQDMFGKITDHAMQALKVADIPIPPACTRVVAAREVSRTPNKTGTPKTPCEALLPGHDLPLFGRLFVDTQGGTPRITLPGGRFVSLEDVSARCHAFYGKRFREESQRFYALPHLKTVSDKLAEVARRVENIDPKKEILLRVGHYSHVECVTVSDNAPAWPKIHFKRWLELYTQPQSSWGEHKQFLHDVARTALHGRTRLEDKSDEDAIVRELRRRKKHGTTRTLADGELPFGWVVLRLCGEDEYREGLRQAEVAIAKAAREREANRADREAAWQKAQEELMAREKAAAAARAEAEAERLRQEQEAAAREAALAHLSPEERAIAEVAQPTATEEQSMKLYAQLDTLDGELRIQAAQTLQACWQRLGKWEGKQLSKKQTAKVARVRKILGN